MTLPYQYSYTKWKISSTSTVTYYYNFRVLNAADVKLYYKATDTAVEQEFTYGTHYYVLDVGQDNGGRLTLTAAALAIIQVNGELQAIRKIEYTQPFDYVENSTFPAQTHENSIDRTMMCVQQNSRCAEQRLWVNEEFIDLSYTVVERAANGYLRWHEDGKGLYASFLTTTLFDVSAYYKTQLPLTTATFARAGLNMASYPNDMAFKSKANTFTGNVTFLNKVYCSTGADPALKVNGPLSVNLVQANVSASAKIGFSLTSPFPAGYFKNLYISTNASIQQSNIATLYIKNILGQVGFTSLVSANNIKASTLVTGPSAHFNNLQINTKIVIPDATLATHAMAYGQRDYSDYLGRISGLQFSYLDATNFYIGPGEVSVNKKMKKLPNQIQKTITGSLGKLYVWVQPGSEVTLTGSMFHTSTTLPVYVNHLKAYYATSTSPYVTRCIGSLYLTGTDTLAPFFTVGNEFNFTNPINYNLLSGTSIPISPDAVVEATPTNYGPTIPGVYVRAILAVQSTPSITIPWLAGLICSMNEAGLGSPATSNLINRACLMWRSGLSAQAQTNKITTRVGCYANSNSKIRIYGGAKAGGALFAYQVGWDWPIGLRRT